MDRTTTGSPDLDAILGGGIPQHSIVLLAGAPGSGKTILGEQFAFANGTAQRPALYLTTANESLDKVVRFGQQFEFFDASAIGSRVVYESLAEVLVEHARGELGPGERRVAEQAQPPLLRHVDALADQPRDPTGAATAETGDGHVRVVRPSGHVLEDQSRAHAGVRPRRLAGGGGAPAFGRAPRVPRGGPCDIAPGREHARKDDGREAPPLRPGAGLRRRRHRSPRRLVAR